MEQPIANKPGPTNETMASLLARLTTQLQSRVSKDSEKKEKSAKEKLLMSQQWINKWLPMKITHPQVEIAQFRLRELAESFAKNPARGQSLILFGENGSGKSRLARHLHLWVVSCAQQMRLVNGDDGLRLANSQYVHWPKLVDGFQKRQEFSVVDDMEHCDLLVVDDIGAEHDPSGYGKEQLYLLLSHREFRWNLITTNFPPAKWYEKLERRIASRLFRNAEHIDMSKVPDFGTI